MEQFKVSFGEAELKCKETDTDQKTDTVLGIRLAISGRMHRKGNECEYAC